MRVISQGVSGVALSGTSTLRRCTSGGKLPAEQRLAEVMREVDGSAEVDLVGIRVVVLFFGLQRDRQAGDAHVGGFQGSADRARGGDPTAHVLPIVDARNYQVRLALEDFEHGVEHYLSRRASHGVSRPFLAVQEHLARFDHACGSGGHAAAGAGILPVRCNHHHVPKRGQGARRRPQPVRADAIIVGQ